MPPRGSVGRHGLRRLAARRPARVLIGSSPSRSPSKRSPTSSIVLPRHERRGPQVLAAHVVDQVAHGPVAARRRIVPLVRPDGVDAVGPALDGAVVQRVEIHQGLRSSESGQLIPRSHRTATTPWPAAGRCSSAVGGRACRDHASPRWSSLSRPRRPGGRACRDHADPVVEPVETTPPGSGSSRPGRGRARRRVEKLLENSFPDPCGEPRFRGLSVGGRCWN